MNLFDVFTPKAETYYLTADMSLRQALEKFDYHKFSVVPVISEDGKYLTTLSQGDVLRYIKEQQHFDLNELQTVKITEIERYRSYEACKHTIEMQDMLKLGLQQNFIPIVDDRGMYIGIVKRKAIIMLLAKKVDSINMEEILK